MTPVPDITHEARRLRFSDAAVEQRFHEERQTQALTRVRLMTAISAMVVGALGYADLSISRQSPDFVETSLQIRFLIVAPVWVAMIVSTYLPRHLARAEALYAVGTTVSAWALAVLGWCYALYFPGAKVAQVTDLNVLEVLFIAIATLPLRFSAMAATVVATAGGVIALFLATRPLLRADDVQIVVTSQPAIAVLLLVVGWMRETGERRMFAQREHTRALNLELERLNAEKNEFMAIAAHDLRAPLASVRGLASQLQAGRLTDGGKLAQAHAAIHELSGRMLTLVNDYLGAHAAESGTLEVKVVRVDPRAAAESARIRQTAAADSKQQTILVEATDRDTHICDADEALLAQVVDNFVTNALKFSPPGAQIRLAARAHNGTVRLAVTDAGPGIAPDEQARLFKKFGRTSTPPTGGETTYGLGLAVAKRLAELMGGTVGCDSHLGAGATFWIELPLSK